MASLHTKLQRCSPLYILSLSHTRRPCVQSINGTSSASIDSKFDTEVYEVMLQCRFSPFFDSAARGPARAKKLHFFGILGQIYLLLGY